MDIDYTLRFVQYRQKNALKLFESMKFQCEIKKYLKIKGVCVKI